MDRIVHESVLTNTSDEKVNALMYQAMLDETIRLRSCRKEAERNQIRKFLMEAYQLYCGRNQKNERLSTTHEDMHRQSTESSTQRLIRKREEMMVAQKVDTTIECVCDFLKREIEKVSSIYESQELTELTKALAELVSARAKLN